MSSEHVFAVNLNTFNIYWPNSFCESGFTDKIMGMEFRGCLRDFNASGLQAYLVILEHYCSVIAEEK